MEKEIRKGKMNFKGEKCKQKVLACKHYGASIWKSVRLKLR